MSKQLRLIAPTADFALRLLAQEAARNPGKNVLVSPLSVSVALGMTLNGARGETADQMRDALGLDDYGDDGATNNAAYANLLAALAADDLGVELAIANAIYASDAVAFHDAFMALNKEHFGAAVESANFASPATLAAINAWASEKTRGKIPSILQQLDANAIMVLLNAVYFKGQWTTKFNKAYTQDQPFHAPAGDKDIPLMFRSGKMLHSKDDGHYEAVALPFGKAEDICLFVLLPEEGTSVDDLVTYLTADKLSKLIRVQQQHEVALHLPRFQVEYDESLNDSLQALGIEAAFASNADFSGMCEIPPVVKISDVKHKTFCKIDEEGAEAAAVTAVTMTRECVFMPPQVRVDRPFVTVIADTTSGAVLFAGVINDPQ